MYYYVVSCHPVWRYVFSYYQIVIVSQILPKRFICHRGITVTTFLGEHGTSSSFLWCWQFRHLVGSRRFVPIITRFRCYIFFIRLKVARVSFVYSIAFDIDNEYPLFNLFSFINACVADVFFQLKNTNNSKLLALCLSQVII